MLKTSKNGKLYLITQPDHAKVSGYLAAHWGNDEFARPGFYAPAPDPDRLRAETVLAIAEHDNGWWEWEAIPQLSASDGYPRGLSEVLKDQQAGMERWRLGTRRFRNAPYPSLLISYHAYWLYATRVGRDPDPAFVHSLFWKTTPEPLYAGSQQKELEFMAELEGQQRQWMAELRADAATAVWVEPEHLNPHVRLLQLLDGMSLSLCSALIPTASGKAAGFGEGAFELRDVPRRDWNDRVTIDVAPAGERRIRLAPYPFDQDPLTVPVIARVFDAAQSSAEHFQSRWHAQPLELIEFRYASA